ncbi:MAG: hypothetical protein WAO07_05450, partial [Desulfobacterales bacterium]
MSPRVRFGKTPFFRHAGLCGAAHCTPPQPQTRGERPAEKGPIIEGSYPNVAKVGGLQSQGVKGEAVNSYRNPLTTQDLK